MTQTLHRQLLCTAIIAALIPLGLLCRFVPIGLSPVIVKYGGSFLWAAAVYWLVAALLPRLQPLALGVVAVAVATTVEYVKWIQTPGLNAFRDTFAGKVLLGRYFSYTDIAVYVLAIICAASIDAATLRARVHRTTRSLTNGS